MENQGPLEIIPKVEIPETKASGASGSEESPLESNLTESYNAFEALKPFLVDDKPKARPTSEVGHWLEHCSKTSIAVSVSNDVIVKKKYFIRSKDYFDIVFVQENGFEAKAQRSYNDFKRLRSTLRARFSGALVPPLPGHKCSHRSMVAGLDLFVKDICLNPLFVTDDAVKEFFLNCTVKFDEDHIKSFAPKSQGIDHWEELVDIVTMPGDCYTHTKQVVKELEKLRSAYRALRSEMRSVSSNLKKQAKLSKKGFEFYDKWLIQEGTDFKHLYGVVSDPTHMWEIPCNSVNMPGMLDKMKEVADDRVQSLQLEAENVLDESQVRFRFELLYLQEIINSVHRLKHLVKRNGKSMSELTNLRNQVKLLGPTSEKYAKVKSRIDFKESRLLEEQVKLKVAIKAMIFETDRYRYERTARATQLMHSLMKVRQSHAERSSRLCEATLNQIPGKVPPVTHLISYRAFRLAISEEFSEGSPGAQAVSFTEGTRESQSPRPATQPRLSNQRSSMRAICAFRAEEEGEIDVDEGEVVEIVQHGAEGEGWSTVETQSGLQGLVPTSYLSDCEGSEVLESKVPHDPPCAHGSSCDKGVPQTKAAYEAKDLGSTHPPVQAQSLLEAIQDLRRD